MDLTESGRKIMTETFELQLRRERAWFAALGHAEQGWLVATLRKLIESHPLDENAG